MSNKSQLVLLFLICAVIALELTESLEQKNNEEKAGTQMSRRRKHRRQARLLLPMIFAAILIKSVLFPLAFKVMATMSSISVVLSTMSLIIASIIGYTKLAGHPATPIIKLHHHHEHDSHHDYRRYDKEKAELDEIFRRGDEHSTPVYLPSG